MIKNISIRAGFLIAIILIVNLVGTKFHFRFDLTEDKDHTLSKTTTDILDDLGGVITIRAYFSEDLPPQYVEVREGFHAALLEYANCSGGKIVYEFINPDEDASKQQDALNAGIRPLMINVLEKGQKKKQKAFMGLVIKLEDKSEVIPLLQPGTETEYEITKAIKKCVVKDKQVVGFLQGHGEPRLTELYGVRERLEVLYQIQEILLTDSTEIPSGVLSLVLVRPIFEFNNLEIQKLQHFLDAGGNLVIALNRVDGNLQQASGNAVITGLERWLQQLGIEAEDNFVVDASCASITLQQQTGAGILSRQISFPYMPVISTFAQHPITQGLKNVVMQFASNLKYTGDSSRRFTPIAFSSSKSALQKAPLVFDVQHQWTASDFPLENIPVAGILEDKSATPGTSTLVLIADGDFSINGPTQEARGIQPDNINLMVNAIDWLSEDPRIIELRTKRANSRPIRQPEESSIMLIKFANIMIPLILALAYGIYRLQRNINRQKKLMREKTYLE
jgi:hypothetical protein